MQQEAEYHAKRFNQLTKDANFDEEDFMLQYISKKIKLH